MRLLLRAGRLLSVFFLFAPLAARADDTQTIDFQLYSIDAAFNGAPTAPLIGTGSFTVDWSQSTGAAFAYGDDGSFVVTGFSYSAEPYGASSIFSATYPPFNTGDQAGVDYINDPGGPIPLFFFFSSSVDPLYIYSDGGPSYQYNTNILGDFGYVTFDAPFNPAPPVSDTPEPSSMALLGTGLTALMAFGRKRMIRS